MVGKEGKVTWKYSKTNPLQNEVNRYIAIYQIERTHAYIFHHKNQDRNTDGGSQVRFKRQMRLLVMLLRQHTCQTNFPYFLSVITLQLTSVNMPKPPFVSVFFLVITCYPVPARDSPHRALFFGHENLKQRCW